MNKINGILQIYFRIKKYMHAYMYAYKKYMHVVIKYESRTYIKYVRNKVFFFFLLFFRGY